MKEYMVHIWGGAFNPDALPSLERDHGITEGYYYFSTEKEKDDFISLVRQPQYSDQGLMTDIKYGEMSHKRTIFVGTLKYQDKKFIIHYDFGYEFEKERAIFMFENGDYSCDCNRSLFIRKEYGDDSIPELYCGDGIKLIDYYFEYRD